MKSRTRMLIVMLIIVLCAFAYYCGRLAAYRELAARPFDCVPGQILDLPDGHRYVCVEVVQWEAEQ